MVTVRRLDELPYRGRIDPTGGRSSSLMSSRVRVARALHGAGDLVRSFTGALARAKLLFVVRLTRPRYYEVMAGLELAGLRFVRLSDVNYHPQTGDLCGPMHCSFVEAGSSL